MENILNKIFSCKFVIFLLKKFSTINFIHFNFIKDLNLKNENTKLEIENIVSNYNRFCYKMGYPVFEKFFFRIVPEENISYIIFYHGKQEANNNGKNRH